MKKDFITTIVSNLIYDYLKGSLYEMDLYNSILKLIYYSDRETKDSLRKIVSFFKSTDNLTQPEKTELYSRVLSRQENLGDGYVDGLEKILEGLANGNQEEQTMKSYDEHALTDKITQQYNKRIEFIKTSNKSDSEKDLEIAKLIINCTFDPRRPEVSYTSREQAERSIKVQEILDSLTDEEFLTDSYVLNWHDLLNS